MIACVFGRAFVPFVEKVVHDLRAATAALGGEMHAMTLETALADPKRAAEVRRLYVLPLDAPAGTPPALFMREVFPHAETVTSFAVQDLCWDKIATQEVLVKRGVPVPDTVISSEPEDVLQFVAEHEFAVLKQRHGCGGQGHLVVWFEDGELVGDSGSHQYRIKLASHGRLHLAGDQLTYPGPFYAQRLVADVDRRLSPCQILRAYIVDSQIAFWTERYRDQYLRPSDWIVSAGRGAKYRFLHDLSEEAKKVAIRSAEVIGIRAGAVDLVRTGSAGPYVLEVETDGHHTFVDRQFKHLPEYRDFFNLDRYIAEALLAEPAPPQRPPMAKNSR